MANGVIIPDLPQATGLGADDLLVKDDGTTTQKLPVSNAYASAEQPGLVSTGTQTLGGQKYFNNNLIVRKQSNVYPEIELRLDADTDEWVGVYGAQRYGDSNRLYVQVRTGDGNNRDFYEFPKKSLTDAVNGNYEILTTKNVATLTQLLKASTSATTGTWSLYNGTGTIDEAPQVLTNSTNTLVRISGRMRISGFSKTGGNPGIQVQTSLRPSSSFSWACGIRFSDQVAKPERMMASIQPSGLLIITTTETLSNQTTSGYQGIFYDNDSYL